MSGSLPSGVTLRGAPPGPSAGWAAADARRSALLRLAVDALDGSPLYRHLAPDPDSRAALLRAATASFLRRATRSGGGVHVLERGGRPVGLSLVAAGPPHPPHAWLEHLRVAADAQRGRPRALVARLRTLARARRAARAVSPLRPEAPHAHFLLIAVDERHRGRGLGRALFQAQLATAGSRRCHLLTSTWSYVGLYRALGFEVVHGRQLPGGPAVWAMERPARQIGPP